MLYESLNVSLNSFTLHRFPDKNHVRFLRSAFETFMKWILSFCLLIKINFSLIKQFRMLAGMCNIEVPFLDMVEGIFSPQRVTPSGILRPQPFAAR